VTARAQWEQFREFVEASPPLADADFEAVLARIAALDDAWLRRACLVTLVRTHRDVCSDAQLRAVAARHGGKLAAFIATVLARRATSRARAPSSR